MVAFPGGQAPFFFKRRQPPGEFNPRPLKRGPFGEREEPPFPINRPLFIRGLFSSPFFLGAFHGARAIPFVSPRVFAAPFFKRKPGVFFEINNWAGFFGGCSIPRGGFGIPKLGRPGMPPPGFFKWSPDPFFLIPAPKPKSPF